MSRKLVVLVAFVSIAAFSSHAVESDPPDRAGSESAEIDRAEQTSDDDSSDPRRLTLSPENRSVEGLQATTSTDGVTRVDLQNRFRHTLILKIAPDGSRSVECIDSHDREVELLKPLHKSTADEGRE